MDARADRYSDHVLLQAFIVADSRVGASGEQVDKAVLGGDLEADFRVGLKEGNDDPRQNASGDIGRMRFPIAFSRLITSDDSSGAAWRSKPTYYIVGTDDRTVDPDLERFVAKRMNAKITELASSHVPMLSQPQRVYQVIREAAEAISQGVTDDQRAEPTPA